MSDAQLDPHILVSARARHNAKLLALPSDNARWAWVVTLGEAKLQRPAGRFPSLLALHEALGRYSRFVDTFLSTGLLHQVGHLCERCAKRLPFEDRRPGEYVVHDWTIHQERSRTTQWREARGLTSGHQTLSGETVGETLGKQMGNVVPRARDRAQQSQSPLEVNTEETGVGGPGEGVDAAVTWYQLVGTFPTGRLIRWIDEASAEFGADVLSAAIAAAHLQDANPKTLMGRAVDRCRYEQREREKAAEQAEKERLAQWARERAITPEQAAENAARVRELTAQLTRREPPKEAA